MTRILLAIAAVVVVGVIVLGVRTLGARDETSAIDSRDAREVAGDGDEEADGRGSDSATVDAGLRPTPGTYEYSGSGSESISALGGSRHEFPSTVAVVVTLDAEDDCAWTADMVYVEEHVEERRFCTDDRGLRDGGFTRRIEFFNKVQTAEYACEQDARRVHLDARPGQSWSWKCMQGAHTTGRYTATLVGTERLIIGGTPVETSRVRIVTRLVGDTQGRDNSEFWFARTGLAVRFTTQLDVVTMSVLGDTTFAEQAEYELNSLEPVDE